VFDPLGARYILSKSLVEGDVSVAKKLTNFLGVVCTATSIPMRGFRNASQWLIKEARSFYMAISSLVFFNMVKTRSSCGASVIIRLNRSVSWVRCGGL